MKRNNSPFPVLGYKNQHSFYASPPWRRLRAFKLSLNPFCERCQEEGITVPATDVDHIKELREFPALGLEITNLRSLCHTCHSKKTAKAQGATRKKGRILTKFNFKTRNNGRF